MSQAVAPVPGYIRVLRRTIVLGNVRKAIGWLCPAPSSPSLGRCVAGYGQPGSSASPDLIVLSGASCPSPSVESGFYRLGFGSTVGTLSSGGLKG